MRLDANDLGDLDNISHTSKTQHTRAKGCVEDLIVYVHIISFKKFILERACKPIKPGITSDKLHAGGK